MISKGDAYYLEQKDALDFLVKLAEGIALMFGDQCETLVHDMSGKGLSTVAIFNGHVSGRQVGSTLSIYGKDTIVDDGNQDLDSNYLNQLVTTPFGKEIKSSTFHMRSKTYHYALGINYNITLLNQMNHFLNNMITSQGELLTSMSSTQTTDLQMLFDSSLQTFYKPLNKMNKTDRLALVRLLNEKGVFHMQRSVPYVAERMGISKYTIYNYLKELEE